MACLVDPMLLALSGHEETWTSKRPKMMDPILPVLSILGYWAITLGLLEVQEPQSERSLFELRIASKPCLAVQ